jgi:hypothetical protein
MEIRPWLITVSDGREVATIGVPARFRHLRRLALRYPGWDLRSVWLVDPRTGAALERLYPLDRARNSEGVRRPLAPPSPPTAEIAAQPVGIAPLLRQLMADYAATGRASRSTSSLPPSYSQPLAATTAIPRLLPGRPISCRKLTSCLPEAGSTHHHRANSFILWAGSQIRTGDLRF